ncbi:MAG: phytoene desaturase family protein [Haliea sp.]
MAATGTVVIGAGIGGMVAALELALAGEAVTVLEAEDRVGGKLRQIAVGEHRLDSGPTVFTMRWVFDALFAAAGSSLEEQLQPSALEVLARHYWEDGSRLELHADRERSADAIGDFAGAAAAAQFLRFCRQTQRMYSTLEIPFLRSPRPSTMGLSLKVLRQSPAGLLHIHPFRRMAAALARNFTDPRLRQLYGRYATYCGSSPYLAPATLMLVANVEQQGVWQLRGGMQSLADALHRLALAQGVQFQLNSKVAAIDTQAGRVSGVRTETGELLSCEAVICNADPAALRQGLR